MLVNRNKNSILVNFTCVAILLVILFYVLKIGATVIIPFVIALLFSFAIIWLSNFYKKFKVPSFVAFILSIATYIFIFWLIGEIVGSNINELIVNLSSYQGDIAEKIIELSRSILSPLGIKEPENLSELLKTVNLQSIFTKVISAFTSIFSRMGLIIFFLIFILLENRFLNKKLYLMIRNNPKGAEMLEILEKIESDVKTYFFVKTIVSLVTGILCYIVMLAFGLNYAIFFGLLAFLLNFIPNIGSIIAVVLPTLFSLAQPGFTFSASLFMFVLLSGVELVVGQIFDPQFMGNKLNLSPLVIVLSLAFWGMIWGIIGMFLCVPIMVIVNIILAKIPATRPIAILLSEKGDLQVESEDVVKRRKKLLESLKSKFDKTDIKKKKGKF